MTSTNIRRLGVVGTLLIISVLILLPTFIRSGMPEWWPSKPIKLGLDLKGGIYLVLGVETEEALKSALGGIGNALKAELRKDKVGVLRARSTADKTLEVTLVSAQGVTALDDKIQKEFPQLTKIETSGETSGGQVKVVYRMKPNDAQELERNSVEQAIETIRNRVDQFGVSEPQILRVGEKRINVQLPDVTDLEQVKKTIGSVAKLEFRLVADPNRGSGSTETFPLKDGGEIRVEDEVVMTGDSIEKANVEIDPSRNSAHVALKLTPTGSKIFDNVTGANKGRQLAIILDKVAQSAPVINDRISGGRAQITGQFTPEEAHWLALVLRAGALPAPLTFLEQRTIGASLGADSVHKGIIATLTGALIVVIFMVAYYQKAGLIAVAAVFLNVVMLLAGLSLFGATLTLPGIAGIALTVGMAVDANVLIYERMREELRNGSGNRSSIEAGFLRAHWTILDANLTTLLVGMILYSFGTGPIKGFAVTLSLGIATTLFAALFATKVLFDSLDVVRKDGRLSIG